MIAPTGPLPQPLPVPAGAATPDAAKGDPFTAALAAAMARVPAPTGTDSDRPAVGSEALPPAPLDPPVPVHRHDLEAHAEMFNQSGFFGDAGSPAGMPIEPIRAAMPAPSPLRDSAARVAAPIEASRPLATVPPIESAAPAGATMVGNTVRHPVARSGKGAQAGSGTVQASGVAPPASRSIRTGSAPAAERLAAPRRFAPQRAANSVAVAVREIEHGVEVIARAGALAEAERTQLHDAIAALLARHGIAARAIRIAAPLKGKPR